MSGVLAVARLTWLGMLRRGFLWVIAAEIVLVGFAAVAMPFTLDSHHAARLRMTLFTGTEAAILLATLIAAFGAAPVLPNDTVAKRHYLVLTKPCSRAAMVMGRFIGYSFGLLVLHAVWGLVIGAGVLSGLASGSIEAWQTDVRLPLPATSVLTSGPGVESLAEDVNIAGTGAVWRLGAAGDTAVFAFTGIAPASRELELTLDLGANYRPGNGPWRSTEVAISMRPGSAGGDGEWGEPIVDRLRFRKPLSVQVPPQLVAGGSLEVRLERHDDRFDLFLRADRAQLFQPGGSLVVSLAAAMLLLWLRAAIVVAMAMLASALFSGPVAVLFALFLVLLGQIAGFTEQYSRTVIESSEQAPVHATSHAGHGHDHRHDHGSEMPSGAAVRLAHFTLQVVWLFPHLDEFDARSQLLWGVAVPGGKLLVGFGTAGIHCIVLVGLAVLAFRRRSLP